MASHARHKALAASLFTLLTLAACNVPPHVATDYDDSVAFAKFRSFTLMERPHPAAKNPLVAQRTYDAIRAELTGKGFTYTDDAAHADFAVDFAVGARDRWDVRSYAAPAGPMFGPGAWVREVDLHEYREGSLEIDVFDLRSGTAVWRGQAEKELSQSEIDRSGPLIRETVAAVLANFPPK